jgi:hypothetical protein
MKTKSDDCLCVELIGKNYFVKKNNHRNVCSHCENEFMFLREFMRKIIEFKISVGAGGKLKIERSFRFIKKFESLKSKISGQ